MSAYELDPTGYLLLAFVLAVGPLYVGVILWAGWNLFRAALRGRRERIARERRARPGPNWLAADVRRRRAGTQS